MEQLKAIFEQLTTENARLTERVKQLEQEKQQLGTVPSIMNQIKTAKENNDIASLLTKHIKILPFENVKELWNTYAFRSDVELQRILVDHYSNDLNRLVELFESDPTKQIHWALHLSFLKYDEAIVVLSCIKQEYLYCQYLEKLQLFKTPEFIQKLMDINMPNCNWILGCVIIKNLTFDQQISLIKRGIYVTLWKLNVEDKIKLVKASIEQKIDPQTFQKTLLGSGYTLGDCTVNYPLINNDPNLWENAHDIGLVSAMIIWSKIGNTIKVERKTEKFLEKLHSRKDIFEFMKWLDPMPNVGFGHPSKETLEAYDNAIKFIKENSTN